VPRWLRPQITPAAHSNVRIPTGHTGLRRYGRGRIGTIEALREGYVFPDTNAHGQGESPQHVYTVVFEGRELWGREADPTLTVSIDAWESYLERL